MPTHGNRNVLTSPKTIRKKLGKKAAIYSFLLMSFMSSSSVAVAGVGTCETQDGNGMYSQSDKSRLKQPGCKNLGLLVLERAYDGISAENIYLEQCTQKQCGDNYGRYHPGIDFNAEIGTPVYSPIEGKVTNIDKANGTISIQKRNSKTNLLFGHLSVSHVKVGDNIWEGCLIGKTGKTSAYFPRMGAHLHVEARTNGRVMHGYFTSRQRSMDTKDPALIPPKMFNPPSRSVNRTCASKGVSIKMP